MNLRPLAYEASELPGCSTPQTRNKSVTTYDGKIPPENGMILTGLGIPAEYGANGVESRKSRKVRKCAVLYRFSTNRSVSTKIPDLPHCQLDLSLLRSSHSSSIHDAMENTTCERLIHSPVLELHVCAVGRDHAFPRGSLYVLRGRITCQANCKLPPV